jgi:hypothetical protein
LHAKIAVITMRIAILGLLLSFLLTAPDRPASAFSDAELIDGFNRTVFGSEFPNWGWQSNQIKKYTVPVRFYIESRAAPEKRREAVRFVRTLPQKIHGLEATVVDEPGDANFRIFIVDRAAYRDVVAHEIYGRPTSAFAPGKCLVRVVSDRDGIQRSDAVIVADEGEFLFKRCLVEETLQGLGPVNDDASLSESVFNDQSLHSTFTAFDRAILNMLYHPSVRPGMSRAELRRVLPAVVADVRKAMQ